MVYDIALSIKRGCCYPGARAVDAGEGGGLWFEVEVYTTSRKWSVVIGQFGYWGGRHRALGG